MWQSVMQRFMLLVGIIILLSLGFATSCVTKEYPVTETYYVTESRTEYKSETYDEIQNVVVNTVKGRTFLTPVVKWNDSLCFVELGQTTPLTFYYGYEFYAEEHSSSEIKVSLSPGLNDQRGYVFVLDLTNVGQIPPGPTYDWWGFPSMRESRAEWLAMVNAQVGAARIIDSFWLGPNESSKKSDIKFDANGVRAFAIMVSSYYTNAILNVQLTWSDEIVQKKLVTLTRQVPYQVPVQVEKQRTVIQKEQVPIWEAVSSK